MDDLRRGTSFLVWAFLILEISMNANIVWSKAAKISASNVAIFSCAMVVRGARPTSCTEMDAAPPLHAIQYSEFEFS